MSKLTKAHLSSSPSHRVARKKQFSNSKAKSNKPSFVHLSSHSSSVSHSSPHSPSSHSVSHSSTHSSPLPAAVSGEERSKYYDNLGSKLTFPPSRLLGHVGFISSFALLTLLLLAISPSCPDGASAEEVTPRSTMTDDTLSVALDSSVDLLFTPAPEGTFSSEAASLKIASGRAEGYTAYISTMGDTGSMTRTDGGSGEIPAVNTTTPASDLNNTWGYALTGEDVSPTAYEGVTPEQAVLVSTESPSTDFYDLSVAAKVNLSVPSGHYQNNVLVSVVANPKKVTDLTSIDFMQEMTPEVCAATTTPTAAATTTTTESTTDTSLVPQKTLIDSRDNKSYVVRKLADGKCWMTQDLNYVLSTSKALTPADSDVQSNWTPNNDTQTNTGTDWDYYTTHSYTNGTRTYYNWYAATGGTNNSSGSVCPKGFTLPAPDNYSTLLKIYGISNSSNGSRKLRSTPLNFILNGRYNTDGNNLLFGEGAHGFYWSNHPYNDDALTLFFISSEVDPRYRMSRKNGIAIRCLSK